MIMFHFSIQHVFQSGMAAKFGNRLVVAGLLLFLTAFSADVFTQTIRNPESSIDLRQRGSLTVDPVTHALQFSISLGEYAGRGGNLPIVLNYSSKVWSLRHQSTLPRIPTNPDEGPFDQIYDGKFAQDSAAGWTSTLDWVRFPAPATTEQYDNNGNPVKGQGQWMAARIYVNLPDGSKHEMRRDDGVYWTTTSTGCRTIGEECAQPNIFYNPPALNGIYYAVDGSRMKYDTATKTLSLADGSRYVFVGTRSAPESFTYYDVNGNVLTYNYAANQWTDTLGRSFQPPLPNANQVGITFGVTPREDVYQLPGLNGATQRYVLRWKYLRDPATSETVLSNPNQSLLPIGDRVSRQTCELTPSLFVSVAPCEVGPEGNDVEMIRNTAFNPVVLAEIELPNGSK